MKFAQRIVATSLVVALATVATACSSKDTPTVATTATGRGGSRPTVVVVQTVEPKVLVDATEALGTAKANEAVDITAKLTNRVEALHIREGQFVNRGDILVEFDATEVRANLAAAEATARDSQSLFERGTLLYQSKALSESDQTQLEAKMLNAKSLVGAAQARLNDTVIRAPFSGRLGLRNVSVGSLVTPGQIITTLDDISIIKLDFSLPESYLATVKVGQEVKASSPYSDEVFLGRVSSIATRIDPVSRSIIVRALIENKTGRLKPGMFMSVSLQRSSSNALLVPEQALVPEADRQHVFVVASGKAHKVEVKLGQRELGLVEIRQGLQAGDVVVVEGNDRLREGDSVTVKAAMAAPDS
ncbi:MAG: efflux RND transporter periplasmic adaptor subunit [Steroidobacteraceae bacterium]